MAETKKEVWMVASLKEVIESYVRGKLPKDTMFTINGLFSQGAQGTETFAICVVASEPTTVEVAEPDLDVVQIMLGFEEGFSLDEYPDSKGIPTIGIGHRIRPQDRAVIINGKASKAQVIEWFNGDIAESVRGAKAWLGEHFDKLSVNRQAVIIGMFFQMGATEMQNFGPTRQHIIDGAWNDVKEHFFSTQWYEDTPERVRRMAYIMITNNLPTEYTPK